MSEARVEPHETTIGVFVDENEIWLSPQQARTVAVELFKALLVMSREQDKQQAHAIDQLRDLLRAVGR